MAAEIDYFYTHISPWAYLGHAALLDLADRTGAFINPRPVGLGGVFDKTGGLPLGKRHPARQAYRFIELQRWRDRRGVDLTYKPKFFPTDPTLADCCTIALARTGGPAMEFTTAAFRAVWVEDKDIADETEVQVLLATAGANATAIIDAAKTDEVVAAYAQNQADAVTLGVVGSPCYVLNGEPFWGQDRLEILEDALVSGRPPYVPL